MFDFRDLFVLDLANNHQGDLKHALNIIEETSNIVQKNNIRAAFKFQFRQLDSFIHPNHQNRSELKHIKRFKETELSMDKYTTLFDAVKNSNMLTMCTPFDESSVDIIEKFKFDIIKVASCSSKDWPLLEKISDTNIPIIFSTGGLQLSDIDNLVSFFEHKNCDFAIMHCVSIYPTPDKDCNLNQIDVLKNRYPNKVIGWSTHEDPEDIMQISIAVSKGAKMFERHIGKETNDIKLNAYSSNQYQLDKWFKAFIKSKLICGKNERLINPDELVSLNSLKRGVYAKTNLKSGQKLLQSNVYFAMPYLEGQLASGEWNESISLKKDIKKDDCFKKDNLNIPPLSESMIIKKAIHKVKALLSQAKIILNNDFEAEYSHHYGVKKFNEVGVVIITIINRQYCKKILVQLPNQKHPMHYHKLKEETFLVVYGSLNLIVDGKERVLLPGDTCLVQPGVWHSFSSEKGCVFEEISTTHYNNDSVYKDKKINKMKREERKTQVKHWGRWELHEKLDNLSVL